MFNTDAKYTDLALIYVSQMNGTIRPKWVDYDTSEVLINCQCFGATEEEAHKLAYAVLDTLLYMSKLTDYEKLDSVTVRVWSNAQADAKDAGKFSAKSIGTIGGAVTLDPLTGKYHIELRGANDEPLEMYDKAFNTEEEAIECISSDEFADYAVQVFTKINNIVGKDIRVNKAVIKTPSINIKPSIN